MSNFIERKKGFTRTPTFASSQSVFKNDYLTRLFSCKSLFTYNRRVMQQNITPKLVSGFTLVELLVTITVFVILTGIVLFNSNKFDSSVLLHNFGYDVALTIKQAQFYGVNVKESTNATFSSPYGVYFNIGEGGSRTNFILYNDIVRDNKYGDNFACTVSDSECVQKYSMQRGTFIKDICAGTEASPECGLSQLSVLFIRPNPDAHIYVNNLSVASDYTRIILSSADGATTSVIVTSAGQIYTK